MGSYVKNRANIFSDNFNPREIPPRTLLPAYLLSMCCIYVSTLVIRLVLKS